MTQSAMVKEVDTSWKKEFEKAAHTVLPILSYSPEQVDVFILDHSPQSDGKTYVVEGEDGAATFCHFSVDEVGVFIEYILPNAWENRYALVKQCVLALKEQYLELGSHIYLRIHVNEGLPSHAAYFLGLLPELGFQVIPRVKMTAPASQLEHLPANELTSGVEVVKFDDVAFTSIADVYARAYRGEKLDELPQEELEQLRAGVVPYLTSCFEERDAVKTWTGLKFGNDLVAFSFGEIAGDQMKIEEVVVVPEHQARGLGQYLTTACMQKLHEQSRQPHSQFVLGTDRRWAAALRLYHRLGFAIAQVESYAVLVNEPKI